MRLTFRYRLKLCWEILTIKSGHSHTAQDKDLPLFKRGYSAGLKDGLAEGLSCKSRPDPLRTKGCIGCSATGYIKQRQKKQECKICKGSGRIFVETGKPSPKAQEKKS